MAFGMYTYTGSSVSNGVSMDIMVKMFERAAAEHPGGTLDDLKFSSVVQWSPMAGPGVAEITSGNGTVRTIDVVLPPKSKKAPPLIELCAGDTLRLLPSAENSRASAYTVAVGNGGVVSIAQGNVARPVTEFEPRSDDTTDQAAARAWFAQGKFGISSKTLSHVLLGVPEVQDRLDGPYDPADFARCFSLMEQVPTLRARVSEMSAISGWETVAPVWSELEATYRQEKDSPDGKAPVLYARLEELRNRVLIRGRKP